MNNKLWVLLILLLSTGCSKKLSGLFDKNGERLVVRDVNFEYLSAKSKIDFVDEGKSISGSANLRLKKDSIIWISLSPGLGIEAARVLITRDSVFFLNKIDKKYMFLTFGELSEKLHFEVNFDLVQSVILGNLIYPYDRERVVRSSEMYAYSQQHGKFFFENHIGRKTMKLEKVQVEDTLSKHTISVNYSDFHYVEEEVFPYMISAKINYKGKAREGTKTDIEYKQINIEKKPLKFPFNVPKKYEVQ